MSHNRDMAGSFMMLFSALLFGYFGFTLKATMINGQLLVWTLRLSAILFLVSAVLTRAKPVIGNILYFLVGGAGAGMFLVVIFLDFIDPAPPTLSPFLLLIFAVWNGYGSWSALRGVFWGGATKTEQPDRGPPE